MPEFIYILIIAVLVSLTFIFYKRGEGKKRQGDASSVLLLQNQLLELRNTVEQKLGESAKHMQEAVRTQFSESQKVIRDITKQLTEVQETNKQVFNITDQLRSLEQVLKNQKQRGSLGEAGLELILSNILPPTAYKMQYSFKDGDTVDAVIETKDGLIPVDAKFSLDNYMRIVSEESMEKREVFEKEFRNDLKKRIDETSKYVKEKEGTLPFAFMFIPAEAIYYDLLVNEVGSVKSNTRSLLDYAYKDRNVIVVSPTTFAAYLQSVLYGFRAFKIEESAKAISDRVKQLSRHITSYEEYMKKLGSALGTTVNHYNSAYKELKKIDKDVIKIAGGKSGMEPLSLNKPDGD